MNGHHESEAVARARALLDGIKSQSLSYHGLARVAAQLAALIWTVAEARKTAEDRANATLLARLMNDPAGLAFSNLLADRAYRSKVPRRLVSEVVHLLDALGTPSYLPVQDRLALGGVRAVGSAMPAVVARATLARLRQQTRSVILSAREPMLSEHLARRTAEGVCMNLNALGEAVLGDEEAERRVQKYLELLARPDVEAISVKVSTLGSQLRLLAWDATLSRLKPQLRTLYRAALRHRVRRADGRAVPKLVNLDMEAYRDLELTVDLFQQVLGEPEFSELSAGIALQAYLPDSFAVQQELTRWALRRVQGGGAPIRVRLVKGANLAAEEAESAQRGWEVPVYASKAEVDANAKRMLRFACRPEHVGAVKLGVASHNVFDLAYALVLREVAGAHDDVTLELLEGMADHLRRAVGAVGGQVLVYGPVVEERAIECAIAYLIRRLDENTAGDNFLCHSFAMKVEDAAWHEERWRFLRACRDAETVSAAPRRQQDRALPAAPSRADFVNEPDTDFTRAANRAWMLQRLARSRQAPCFEVPLQIAGVRRAAGPLLEGFDPSRPGVVPYRYPTATARDIEEALACALTARAGWAALPAETRFEILGRVAEGLRAARGELITALVLDAGKRVEEADAEVSEAIDFAEYYRRSYLALSREQGVRLAPRGTVVVASPWNFPLAIPAGGTLAALVAGNTVILKPAGETPYVAERFARICWRAGVPERVLELVFCSDEVGSRLITDERVDGVVLTGATATAQLFQELRPDLYLMAETGGKNAMIVSALADRDLAIHHAVHAAFGHAGQKCSALSLLVCEREVYEDRAFLTALRDAAASLTVGSAWDPDSVITPLIHPPHGALARALAELEPGEEWLLEPRPDPDNPRLWTPGIKLGVGEGSLCHTAELFGPVLAVMRADDLDHALAIANGTPYGLTAALHSLDEREQRAFLERMCAGNLYVNRGTTGAVVQRQPFGGCKASCFGPGAKAGGPNYVAQLVRIAERSPRGTRHHGDTALLPPLELLLGRLRGVLPPYSLARLDDAAHEYAWAMEQHYGLDHDPSRVLGQRNVFAYRELAGLVLRVTEDAASIDAALACAAALTCMSRFEISVERQAAQRIGWLGQVPRAALRVESGAELARRLTELAAPGVSCALPEIERLRVVGTPEPCVLAAAIHAGLHAAAEPPVLDGRWELRHYVREQSISIDTHRYGNLSADVLAPVGERAGRSPAHGANSTRGAGGRRAG